MFFVKAIQCVVCKVTSKIQVRAGIFKYYLCELLPWCSLRNTNITFSQKYCHRNLRVVMLCDVKFCGLEYRQLEDRQTDRQTNKQTDRRISTACHCSCCIESSECIYIVYGKWCFITEGPRTVSVKVQCVLTVVNTLTRRIMTVLMKTKFKTAWKLFSLSERQSVTLKWNICECLVGCVDVKANGAGRTDSR